MKFKMIIFFFIFLSIKKQSKLRQKLKNDINNKKHKYLTLLEIKIK